MRRILCIVVFVQLQQYWHIHLLADSLVWFFLFGAEPYSDLEGGFLGKGGGFFGMVFLFCGADVYSDLEGGFLGKGGGFFGNEFLCSVVVVGGAFVVAFGMSTLDITLAYSPFVDEGVDDISSP